MYTRSIANMASDSLYMAVQSGARSSGCVVCSGCLGLVCTGKSFCPGGGDVVSQNRPGIAVIAARIRQKQAASPAHRFHPNDFRFLRRASTLWIKSSSIIPIELIRSSFLINQNPPSGDRISGSVWYGTANFCTCFRSYRSTEPPLAANRRNSTVQ